MSDIDLYDGHLPNLKSQKRKSSKDMARDIKRAVLEPIASAHGIRALQAAMYDYVQEYGYMDYFKNIASRVCNFQSVDDSEAPDGSGVIDVSLDEISTRIRRLRDEKSS